MCNSVVRAKITTCFGVVVFFSREKRIPLVHGALEKICLFHELGCCNLELNRNEEAQKYGLRSVAAAEETDDEKWKMNSNFLVAQSECN